MRNALYLYSTTSLFEIIKEILFDYKFLPLTLEEINNTNFNNNNALLVLKNDISNEVKKSFLTNNNVVIFLSKKKSSTVIIKEHNSRFVYGHTSVKKFIEEVRISFISKTVILKNIEIIGEKITNINSGNNLLLTPLEKEILIVLFKNKKIKREYLLEEILKIKKNIETKTIESHLTRIRRKLLKIKSEIQITSKNDTFYLNV